MSENSYRDINALALNRGALGTLESMGANVTNYNRLATPVPELEVSLFRGGRDSIWLLVTGWRIGSRNVSSSLLNVLS